MSEAKLYLVRHGQSYSNAHQPLVTPELCSLNGLTDLGRQQAALTGEALGFELQNVPASSIHLFSSPLLRALQTALVVQEGINKVRPFEDQVELIDIDFRLREQSFGILEPEYLDNSVIHALYEAHKASWSNADYIHDPLLDESKITTEIRQLAAEWDIPEAKIRGESLEDMTKMTDSWYTDSKETIEKDDTYSIIFGHGNEIRSTLVTFGIESLDELGAQMREKKIRVPNASITRYTRRGEKWDLDALAEVPSQSC